MATASSARPLADSRKLRYRRAGDEATGADGSPERVRRCRARRFTRLFVSTASGRSQILVRRAAPQHADSEEARAARAPQTAQPTISYRLGPCVSLPRPDVPSGSFAVVEPPTERTCLDLPAENDDGHHLEHHCHAGEPRRVRCWRGPSRPGCSRATAWYRTTAASGPTSFTRARPGHGLKLLEHSEVGFSLGSDERTVTDGQGRHNQGPVLAGVPLRTDTKGSSRRTSCGKRGSAGAPSRRSGLGRGRGRNVPLMFDPDTHQADSCQVLDYAGQPSARRGEPSDPRATQPQPRSVTITGYRCTDGAPSARKTARARRGRGSAGSGGRRGPAASARHMRNSA